MRRSLLATTSLVACLVAGLLTLTAPGGATADSSPNARLGETTRPLLDFRGAADPTVVRYGDQYVAISTGPSAPRAVAPSLNGPWTDLGNALTQLPPWALNNRIWASDLVQTDTGWVLYFSAPVAGLGVSGRCIGAAVAASPLDQFVPQQQPLVCPRRAVSDPAFDIARPAKKGLPKGLGVIDPDGFVDRDGKRYVVYRTQAQPASIRIVKVPRSGLASLKRQDSVELLRRRGVIENPILVRRGKWWVMFTSQSRFTDCGYHTTWRKATSLDGLLRARKHTLMDQASTGLCGPGGADLLGETVLFFHSWTCPELPNHCPPGVNYDRTPIDGAHRAMFGAVLSWSSRGKPTVSSFLAPTVDPWLPPPTPAPTPTLTPTPSPSPTIPP